jgi:hypothetical protein
MAETPSSEEFVEVKQVFGDSGEVHRVAYNPTTARSASRRNGQSAASGSMSCSAASWRMVAEGRI